MKKTINGLLLAMAVCAGNAYGNVYRDDTKAQNYFVYMHRSMEDPDKVLEEGKNKLKKWANTQNAIEAIARQLNSIGIDVSSKTPDEIQKLAQDRIKLLDQKIKDKTAQTTSSPTKSDESKKTVPTHSHTSSGKSRGSRARY